MSVVASWNSWRRPCLVKSEAFTGGRTLRTTQPFRLQPERFPKRPLQVRHVSFTIPALEKTRLKSRNGEVRKDIRERQAELDHSAIEHYPRVEASSQPSCTLSEFVQKFSHLKKDECEQSHGKLVVAGRILSVRKSGGKLAFVDIVEEPGHQKLQIVLNLGQLESVEKQKFAAHLRLIRRGDVIAAKGFPARSSSGELSLRATELTTMLSPCLHTIPVEPVQADLSADNELLDKHVSMLADPSIIRTLITRARLIQTMRNFFEHRGFYEVQTPIIAASAGGAAARPFETSATDFPDKKLSLRIAPELWLKRLILGGMSRVFEIGPSFRNEGLDNTHNPEFTTCEFYATYQSLSQLQHMTEELLRQIAATINDDDHASRIPELAIRGDDAGKYPEIDFIPAINSHLGQSLPNLASPDAQSEILAIFRAHCITIPAVPTLPRLLDKLCSHFLEPLCDGPTWIINTPECLSPLAKSFIHPNAPNEQAVAARAELFINQKEIVNCYEEENSPSEQRRKFIDQQIHARPPIDTKLPSALTPQLEDDEAMKVDEDYLRALEWGLPPTGGWGCGIDRLVMLFTNKQRIGDVLTFGNLRAVTRGAERYHKVESSEP